MTTRLNAAPRRGPALDAFRLIAAVLVVTIHTSPLASVSPLADFWLTRVLARLGVPFFLVTTGYFLARRGWRGLRGFWLRTLGVYLAAAVLYLPLNFYAGFSPAAGGVSSAAKRRSSVSISRGVRASSTSATSENTGSPW